jgi:DNA polymerase III delta subunit
MPVIKYTGFEEYLGSLGQTSDDHPKPYPSFFLICGEAFLTRQAFDRLAAFLLKGEEKEFALESVEGSSTSMGDIIEQVTTFSFLLSKKVIAVKNAPLFSSGKTSSEVSYSTTDMDVLTDLVEKGIPEKHSLVIICPGMDKRKKIFKTFQNNGMIIDCTISQGVRKADLDEQRGVLQQIARNLLSESKKGMGSSVFNFLVDQTGFNPDLFAGNIEKLVAYVGTGLSIGIDDIKAVVIRDKKDPIFSLTNALVEKDAPKALVILSSLFKEGFHPLQILKSLENQVRKLLLVKSFILFSLKITEPHHFKRMNFNGFKQGMMPVITAHDGKVKKAMEERDTFLTLGVNDIKGSDSKKPKSKPKEKKKAVPADLLLAPNPKSPYPVFLMFQKSENFSLNELTGAVIGLADLDYQLKSSPIEANIAIENFIITISQ